MNPFLSLRDYEIFVYSLQEQYNAVLGSTLTVARRGRFFAELTGELVFPNGYRPLVYERLIWDTGTLLIEDYGYEVWLGTEQLYWYDSQPHPNDPTLASTHPHYKHVPPDIKHHRILAPGLRFEAPNLPFLIDEIETVLLNK